MSIPINWMPFRQVYEVVKESLQHDPQKWSWTRNMDCKYINVRIDMRTGACLLQNRHGVDITLEQLRAQT